MFTGSTDKACALAARPVRRTMIMAASVLAAAISRREIMVAPVYNAANV
jgi:hypothetical protein